MDKLTIEHVAPYLPYELNAMKYDSYGNSSEVTLDIWCLNKYPLEYNDIKPILRPLSDLTKEIEHNGDVFIPLLELYKLSENDDIVEYKIVTRTNDPEYYTTGIRVLDSEDKYTVLSFSIFNGFATQR